MNNPSGHTPTHAGRFRLARELRGLTQAEVVGRMEAPITFAALSQIESGKSRPQVTTVQQLARALDVPVGFFSIAMPTDIDGERAAFFRDLRATSVRDRRRATALAVVLHDLLNVIENHAKLPDFDLDYPTTDRSQERIPEQVAMQLRRSWSLGEEPIPNLVREMERHGIAVAKLTMGIREVDAFSMRFNQRPLVLLNDDKASFARSRFDAAHELGHIVLHHSRQESSREMEREAHAFASALLFPRSVALEQLPLFINGSGWSILAQLKRKWGISIAALLYRGRDLGILNPTTYANAVRYMSARGWRSTEPGDREMGPPEVPVLLERSIRTIQLNSGMSLEDLAAEAMVPIGDVREVIDAAQDRRPGVAL